MSLYILNEARKVIELGVVSGGKEYTAGRLELTTLAQMDTNSFLSAIFFSHVPL